MGGRVYECVDEMAWNQVANLVLGAAGEVHRKQLDGLERRGGIRADLIDHQLHARGKTAKEKKPLKCAPGMDAQQAPV
jgi:hypothetical protein